MRLMPDPTGLVPVEPMILSFHASAPQRGYLRCVAAISVTPLGFNHLRSPRSQGAHEACDPGLCWVTPSGWQIQGSTTFQEIFKNLASDRLTVPSEQVYC